jgi:periplasmic protein TonB
MRNSLLVLVCFICCASSYGQTATNTYGKIDVEITKENRKKIYAKVEIKSVFPGGDSSWMQSIETKLNQSIQLGKGAKKGKYIVSVQFVVDKDGSISDVKALTSNGYGMEAEVLRAIKKKTKWLPSSQGVPVRPYRTSSSSPPVSN